MFFSRNENTNLTMRKIFTYIYYFSFLTLLFFWANTYALWSQYDVICSGLKATLKVKNCINNVQWVSKCQLDEFKKNVCSIWWGYNIGPLYPIQERMLYSDIDTRISVSTEDMKKELLRYMEKNEVVSYAWEQWKISILSSWYKRNLFGKNSFSETAVRASGIVRSVKSMGKNSMMLTSMQKIGKNASPFVTITI